MPANCLRRLASYVPLRVAPASILLMIATSVEAMAAPAQRPMPEQDWARARLVVLAASTATPSPVFEVQADSAGIKGLVIPKEVKARVIKSTSTPPFRVALSGLAKTASPSGRPPISLALPAEFEKLASGHTVRITVTARAPGKNGSTSFSVTYSTNEVGNSGWKPFAPTRDSTPYSFDYQVPPLKAGKGDFIGILPDNTGADGIIEISSLRAEILDAKATNLAPRQIRVVPTGTLY